MHAPKAIDLREDLARWRAQFPDAVPMADLVARREQTVVGVVERMRIVPGRSFTVRLTDGTGVVEATWSGRSRLPGVELGSGLRCTATVAPGPHGDPLLRNPAWSSVLEPFVAPRRPPA